jgi:phosphate transport system permease protein
MHYFEGSLALGCNKNQSVFQVLLPAAKGGIFSALILGIGRAVGETMAVQMIVGNGSGYPSGAFVPFTTLTSNIVQNWGYAEVWNGDLNAPTQQNALFACGFVLLVIILLLNILLVAVRRQRSGNRFFTRRFEEGNGAGGGVKSYRQTGRLQNGLCVLSWVVAILVAALLATLVVFVLFKGIPHMRLSFLFGRSGNGGITLVPAMTATFMLVVLALFVALPLGIGAAIYLNEYAKKGGRFQKVISLFIDTLAGIPSIIFGIFGYVFFVRALNFGYSLLAGGITLALLVLPTVIRSVWQCLSEVPDSMREASFALGAGKLKTIFCVVMPRALSGILTAVMLSVGRILSESAALIFTVGTAATFVPLGYHEGCASLAVLIWHFMSNGLQTDEAYATAAVLLFLVVAINALIWLLPKFLKGRVSQ